MSKALRYVLRALAVVGVPILLGPIFAAQGGNSRGNPALEPWLQEQEPAR